MIVVFCLRQTQFRFGFESSSFLPASARCVGFFVSMPLNASLFRSSGAVGGRVITPEDYTLWHYTLWLSYGDSGFSKQSEVTFMLSNLFRFRFMLYLFKFRSVVR